MPPRPRPYDEWSVEDVISWLRANKIGDKQTLRAFRINKVDGRHLHLLTDAVLRAEIGIVAWVDRIKILEAVSSLTNPRPARGKGPAGDQPAEAECSKTSRMSEGSAARPTASAPQKRKAFEAAANPPAKKRKGQGFGPSSSLADTPSKGKGKGSEQATMMENVMTAAPSTRSDSSRAESVGVLATPRPVPEDRSAARNKLRDERFKPYAHYGFGKHGRPYELDIDKIKSVTMPTLEKVEDRMNLAFKEVSDETLRAKLAATLHEQCQEASRELNDVCMEVADVNAGAIRQELRMLKETKVSADEEWDRRFFEDFLKEPEDSDQDAAEDKDTRFEHAESSTGGPK